MCLQAVLHLQTVLEGPPKMVSTGKLGVLAFGKQSTIGQTAEADQGVRRTQPRTGAAKGDLQRLRDELDFGNAAAPKLDVETFRATLSLSINLLLRRPHVHKRRGDADVCAEDAIDYPSRKTLIEPM